MYMYRDMRHNIGAPCDGGVVDIGRGEGWTLGYVNIQASYAFASPKQPKRHIG